MIDPTALLPTLLALPLLGGLLLLLPWRAGKPSDAGKLYALIGTLFTFAISLLVLQSFDFNNPAAVQLGVTLPWVERFGLTFAFGVDAMSLWLLLLTTFLMPLVVLGSFSAVKHRTREFYVWLLLLESAMIGTFVARDVIFFYIAFEFTLIPLFFLIGVWGSKQRLRAAKVFFLYTFTGSVLTLAGVLYVAWTHASQSGGWSFDIAALTQTAASMAPDQQAMVLLALCAGFAVKVPLFPAHTWLPLAHTEAPTAGSVILAGVLLKLGTYGLLRFAIPMCPQAVVEYAPLIGTLAVVGILYTALICWVQKDIKKLIAYSSVSHLGFCVLGMFAVGTNVMGQTGSVMYMINHGLSTGALFLCVGMIYERFHTRQMRDLGGLAKTMPVWSCFMVYFCLASVGLPGLNGFVGEFLTLAGAFTARGVLGPTYAAFAGVGMIFGAIYILHMVGKVVFGEPKTPAGHGPVRDLGAREVAVLTPLAIACLVLGIYPKPVLSSLEPGMEELTAGASRIVEQRTALVKNDDDDTRERDGVAAQPRRSGHRPDTVAQETPDVRSNDLTYGDGVKVRKGLKGRHSKAQGEALGSSGERRLSPDGAIPERPSHFALSGLDHERLTNPGLRPGLSSNDPSGLQFPGDPSMNPRRSGHRPDTVARETPDVRSNDLTYGDVPSTTKHLDLPRGISGGRGVWRAGGEATQLIPSARRSRSVEAQRQATAALDRRKGPPGEGSASLESHTSTQYAHRPGGDPQP